MSTGWWVGDLIESGQVSLLAAWVFWVVVSISLHELSHGWAAIWQGDDTPRVTGHMTVNPIVHMGWWSLLAFAITGLAWGAMPVNPSRFRWGRMGDVAVSAAGPAMNILLAGLSLTILGVLLGRFIGDEATQTEQRLIQFFAIGGKLNIILAVFNLLPVPPLDGSQILGGFSNRLREFFHQPFVQMVGFFVMIFILGRLISGPLGRGAEAIVATWVGLVARLVS